MTGFGKAESLWGNKKLIVEIKSLNSKQLDLNLKTAPEFRGHEMALRARLVPDLVRGKVDVAVYTQDDNNAGNAAYAPINIDAAVFYAREIARLREELGMTNEQHTHVIEAVLRMPNVLQTTEPKEVSDDEWTIVEATIKSALNQFVAFRIQEGEALEKMFDDKLNGITTLLADIEPYEKGRIQHIKDRLLTNLTQLSEEQKRAVDQNRLEQEMIYYLEKLDITEEKVRLTNHINYFKQTMQAGAPEGVGKKLGFIAQEMGREINTLGSKSNQSEMQILVVKMKDLLEQIKEQVLNVL